LDGDSTAREEGKKGREEGLTRRKVPKGLLSARPMRREEVSGIDWLEERSRRVSASLEKMLLEGSGSSRVESSLEMGRKEERWRGVIWLLIPASPAGLLVCPLIHGVAHAR
jgi:hypothetical protein